VCLDYLLELCLVADHSVAHAPAGPGSVVVMLAELVGSAVVLVLAMVDVAYL